MNHEKVLSKGEALLLKCLHDTFEWFGEHFFHPLLGVFSRLRGCKAEFQV